MFNKLDLRQIGTVIGLPVYVDVAGVRDYKGKNEMLSERDKKVMLATTIMQKAFNPPPEKVDL